MKERLFEILHLMLEEIINAIIVGSKAIIILIVGIWFAYFIARKMRKLILKTLQDEMLANFLAKVAFIGIVIMAVVVTLGTMGIQTTSIIAALGAAGIAIALALKDSLSNLASGIMIVVFRLFTKNDTIEVNGILGNVEDISLFHTYLKTLDGKLVIIPNTNIATNNVINYTAHFFKKTKNGEIIKSKEVVRRIDWLIGVSYDSDIDKARQIITEAVQSTDNIDIGKKDSSKAIFVGVNELQSSAIEFVVRAWVVDNARFGKTKCDMIENVKKALDKHNIEIPYNKLDVNLIK